VIFDWGVLENKNNKGGLLLAAVVWKTEPNSAN